MEGTCIFVSQKKDEDKRDIQCGEARYSQYQENPQMYAVTLDTREGFLTDIDDKGLPKPKKLSSGKVVGFGENKEEAIISLTYALAENKKGR